MARINAEIHTIELGLASSQRICGHRTQDAHQQRGDDGDDDAVEHGLEDVAVSNGRDPVAPCDIMQARHQCRGGVVLRLHRYVDGQIERQQLADRHDSEEKVDCPAALLVADEIWVLCLSLLLASHIRPPNSALPDRH